MTEVLSEQSLLARCPIVIDDVAQARPLGEALHAGGITVAEVTLRTPVGLEAIAAMAGVDGLVVGAGTVVTAADVTRAVDAGAEFIVSPGLSRVVVEASRAGGIPTQPGIAPATELMAALDLGLTAVKFFPAGHLGGPAGLASLAAPFPTVRFMPSGGVSLANVRQYLDLDAVPAVSGSWMVERSLLEQKDWSEVTRRSAAAMDEARQIRRA